MKNLSDEEWRKKLTPEQYRILREKGTETPFTGELLNNKKTGMYSCAACGNTLFSSSTKFESGSGWPSFYEIAKEGTVKIVPDNSLGVQRLEVVCAGCGGHLGHVFEDGPHPTGKRYCINSVCLNFQPDITKT